MPDEDSEFDHEFEAERICQNCDTYEMDCDCEVDDQQIEDEEGGECAICGADEDDPVHQSES